MRNLIYRLGSRPKQSWAWFLRGLTVFVVGTVLLVSPHQVALLHCCAIALLAIGLLLAIRGYAGIFANRFAQVLNRGARGASANNENSRQD